MMKRQVKRKKGSSPLKVWMRFIRPIKRKKITASAQKKIRPLPNSAKTNGRARGQPALLMID